MRFYEVNLPDEESKIAVIRDKIIMGLGVGGQTIIFVRKRRAGHKLRKALAADHGYSVTTTIGQDQKDSDNIIKQFNHGFIRVLILVDVIAWGVKQSKVSLVINYDLPVIYNNHTEPNNQVYLLRTRFGGANCKGAAVFNLLCGATDNTMVPSWNSDDDFMDALEQAGLFEKFSKLQMLYSAM